MSKFIENIKRITQSAPAPLGFRSTPAAEKPKMLLVAAFSQSNIKNIAEYAAGADAAMLQVNNPEFGMESIPRLSEAVPDIPWGIRLKDIDWSKTKTIKFESDFAVFPADMPLFTLPAKLGRIFEIEPGTADSMLRAIDNLPVEAVFISGKQDDLLNWQFLASLQRIDNLLSKPLLVHVPAGIKGDDLLTLWGIGADGVVVETGAEQAAGKMKELRQAVNNAVFTLPRKTRKSEVMLPFIRPAQPEPEDEEEGPEEE